MVETSEIDASSLQIEGAGFLIIMKRGCGQIITFFFLKIGRLMRNMRGNIINTHTIKI